ncbi:MAG: hypothetical protein OXF72_10600 [Gammaproteobacteria bacterium]|nr:hypothetical protein [Gammaproteobacteria bacterium]MCY4199023.1 hypothetical protein [Gammaproteobacteria bacterium]MCY4277758.1 hypothetical protein [Gammaproteobacteria bacterium]MCY4322211.1 hypothetical protein [Gammaproteobacteria bacterium]
MPQESDSPPEVTLWSDTSTRLNGIDGNAPEPLSEGQEYSMQEKSEADLLAAFEMLETKIEALITRCEELQQLTDSLTAQLLKERESKTALLDIQSDAKKRVDQLIQRLQKTGEAN